MNRELARKIVEAVRNNMVYPCTMREAAEKAGYTREQVLEAETLLSGDGPACEECGILTIWVVDMYKCFNCGKKVSSAD